MSATRHAFRSVASFALVVLIVWLIGTPTMLAAAARPHDRPTPPTDAVAQARAAFARGDLATLLALEPKTRTSPLAATVTSWRLTLQILRDDATLDPQTVTRFLTDHAGTDAAVRVRRALAQNAIAQEAWTEARRHLEALERHDPTTHCWLLQARLHTEPTATATLREAVLTRLAETVSPNDECRAAFRDAVANGLVNDATLIERYLVTLFLKGENAAAPWRALFPPAADTPAVRAAARLIAQTRDDPITVWQQAAQLPPPLAATVRRAAFVVAARQGNPEAQSWLAHLRPSPVWTEPLEWQIRVALQTEDWLTTWHLLEQLPSSERNARQWRFWRAWALKALGKKDEARTLFRELAQDDDFWGLLAGELIGQPLAITDGPPISAQQRAQIARDPHLAAIRALAARSWEVEAQREVDLLAQRWLSASAAWKRRAAASLLAEDGRFDLAIRLLERSQERNAWALRYPTPWRTQVLATAHQERVDPAWVFGVMRQESRFRADARSTSGALGLMQVMPSTGRWVAQQRNERRFHAQQLLEPETNLRFGITYLRIMTEQLDGHPVLATGAYNAGPGRIGRLRQRLDLTSDAALLDALRYIELLPLAETRDYIRKVLANTVVYSHRLGNPKTLSELLVPYGDAQRQLAALSERLQ